MCIDLNYESTEVKKLAEAEAEVQFKWPKPKPNIFLLLLDFFH